MKRRRAVTLSLLQLTLFIDDVYLLLAAAHELTGRLSTGAASIVHDCYTGQQVTVLQTATPASR